MEITTSAIKDEPSPVSQAATATDPDLPKNKLRRTKSGATADAGLDSSKRRCVSTACIACRRRKSKCDGNTPSCAACASVYGTECVYDPTSDHRRKGVYKKDIDNLKTRNSTLQTLVQAILSYPESEVADLVHQIRTADNLDKVAEAITDRENGEDSKSALNEDHAHPDLQDASIDSPKFESYLASKMGELRVGEGSLQYLGGTSNLLYMEQESSLEESSYELDPYQQQENPVISWTDVTTDPELILHLLKMYFTWHYTFFTTLSQDLFWRDFYLGQPPEGTKRRVEYCTPLLVNVMLALGCHFTAHHGARADPGDSATAGDHFFQEAKRLIMDDNVLEKPKLATVQALGLMSVREAGCGRENGGWAYSGMSFRMANDMGLSFSIDGLTSDKRTDAEEEEEDARKITFWGGCYLFDKCWSNYLGRLPLFEISENVSIPKFEVFPDGDADIWRPYSDSGSLQAHAQPSRIRAVSLQITSLCEISGDIMKSFYNPQNIEKAPSKQAEVKKLSEIHTKLESWRRNLPNELGPKEGGLSSVLIMHMFFQVLYIHLFRPFLKYNRATSPLPTNVSPRKLCTQAAGTISKLLRLYKRSHGLRQIVNIAVYIAHTACTVHLLNLPEKNAKRDITHGVKHLEEIAEGWICARRTLCVLSSQAHSWEIELPVEAAAVLARTDAKYADQYMRMSSESPRSKKSKSHSPTTQSVPLVSPPIGQEQWTWRQAQYVSSSRPMQPRLFKAQEAPLGQLHPISGPHELTAGDHFMSMPQVNETGFSYETVPFTSPTTTAGPSMSNFLPINARQQQLPRGEDWWLKDQTNMARGFTNWTMLDNEQQQPMPWNLDPSEILNSSPVSLPNHVSGDIHGMQPYQRDDSQDDYGFIANNYNENDWYT